MGNCEHKWTAWFWVNTEYDGSPITPDMAGRLRRIWLADYAGYGCTGDLWEKL